MASLEARLGVRFCDRGLIGRALTHRSCPPPRLRGAVYSQRQLAFLGDAIMDAVLTAHMCRIHPDWPIGQIVRVKSAVLSRANLGRVALELGIGEALLLGGRTDAKGGRTRPSVLANALEAVVGAIFLENRERTKPVHCAINTYLVSLRIAQIMVNLLAGEQGNADDNGEIGARAEGRASDDLSGAGIHLDEPEVTGSHEGMTTGNILEAVEDLVGIRFRDRLLLEHALLHRSRWPEQCPCGLPPREHIGLVGTAMLICHVGVLIVLTRPNWSVGRLARLRSRMGTRRLRSAVAHELGLQSFAALDSEEEGKNGRSYSERLADCLEILVGALYLDGPESDVSLFVTPMAVLRMLGPSLSSAEREENSDYKSVLNEWCLREHKKPPTYQVLEESGSAADRKCVAAVSIGGRRLGIGAGRTKKEARSDAAKEALAKSSASGIAGPSPAD